jgi:hypothetical protein
MADCSSLKYIQSVYCYLTSTVCHFKSAHLPSHNKPIGCSASGAYAPGPDDEEEEYTPQNMSAYIPIYIALCSRRQGF